MLAIIEALKDWRHFLEGLPQPFEIVTDHSNLEYWRTAQDLSRRQARWALYLSRFDFTLTHRPGKANTQADPLSRLDTHQVSDAQDNRQQTVLRPEQFMKLAATVLVNPLEELLGQNTTREAEVLSALAALRMTGPHRLVNGLPEWEEVDGLVYYKGRIYVPPDDDLKREVLKQCHDEPTSGHPGIHGTYEQVERHYWWPSMRTFVKRYVQGCDTCGRKKRHPHPKATTQPLEVPTAPWEVVGVDLIGELPKSNGYNAICVFTDHFSKMIHAVPCKTSITSEGMADLYFREVFRHHGLPRAFVSDRGSQFSSRLMRTLLKHLGIKSNLTTSYHPQANGQTERANQEVIKHLSLYCDRRQEHWEEHLATAEFAINSRVHSAHGHSPFEAAYGYLPLFNVPVGTKSGIIPVDERMQRL